MIPPARSAASRCRTRTSLGVGQHRRTSPPSTTAAHRGEGEDRGRSRRSSAPRPERERRAGPRGHVLGRKSGSVVRLLIARGSHGRQAAGHCRFLAKESLEHRRPGPLSEVVHSNHLVERRSGCRSRKQYGRVGSVRTDRCRRKAEGQVGSDDQRARWAAAVTRPRRLRGRPGPKGESRPLR